MPENQLRCAMVKTPNPVTTVRRGRIWILGMLEQQLHGIIAFHNGEPVPGNPEILDLRIYWGTLLAGRCPRLQYLQRTGRLSSLQADGLYIVEAQINAVEDILLDLELLA